MCKALCKNMRSLFASLLCPPSFYHQTGEFFLSYFSSISCWPFGVFFRFLIPSKSQSTRDLFHRNISYLWYNSTRGSFILSLARLGLVRLGRFRNRSISLLSFFISLLTFPNVSFPTSRDLQIGNLVCS
jgi:hypothetical protein